MLTTLLLASTLAHATEVATTKKFGIGPSTGVGLIGGTGKYYFSDKAGLAFWLGTSGVYHTVRVNFEDEIVEFADWKFARFDMYWDAGVDAGLWTWVYGGAQLGVGGGVGVELQFNDVPAQVFVDAGLGVYPLNVCNAYSGYTGLCLVQARGSAGGRWYF